MLSRYKNFIIAIIMLIGLLINQVESALAFGEGSLTFQDTAQGIIDKGFSYLASQQNADGGFRWMDETSNVAVSLRVVWALAAAGYTQDYILSDMGERPVDFLAGNAYEWVFQSDSEVPGLSVARAGQMLIAIAAANENPHAFGNTPFDYAYALNEQFDPNTGIYGTSTEDNVIDQVWAMLGLTANHLSVSPDAAKWLAGAQNDQGAWNDGYESYLDTTPLAVMALIASGEFQEDSPEIERAIAFIKDNQQPEGGWQTVWDTQTNANTTAMTLQAIVSLGQDPSGSNWSAASGDPLTALTTLQSENGVIGGDFANTYSTTEAILALTSEPLYNLGIIRRINRAFDFVIASQQEDGGWGSPGTTIDVILALTAAGWDPSTISQDRGQPFDVISKNLQTYIDSGPDAIAKTILALSTVGLDPHDFHGFDLINALSNTFSEETQSFGDPANIWHQALSILGLSAAQETIPEGAIKTLKGLHQEDGGWEYAAGFGTSPDSSALAMQALLAAGTSPDDEILDKSLTYLRTTQTPDGNWGDSSTTSYVFMALNALGIPLSEWVPASGKSPIAALFIYQKQNGAFMFNLDYPEDNLMATSSVLMAVLAGDYLIQPSHNYQNHHAGMVIDAGEGNIVTACVEFSDEAISGSDLLDSTKIPYEVKDGFINSIMDVSNPEGGTQYWSYWHWNGREWIFKNIGMSDSVVKHSAIEAWAFVSWEQFPSLPSKVIPNLSIICGQPILRDYNNQPYLNFDDYVQLKNPVVQMIEETPEVLPTDRVEEATTPALQSTEETPDISTASEVQAQRPNLPFIIIGGIGVGIAIVVALLIVLRNKRK